MAEEDSLVKRVNSVPDLDIASISSSVSSLFSNEDLPNFSFTGHISSDISASTSCSSEFIDSVVNEYLLVPKVILPPASAAVAVAEEAGPVEEAAPPVRQRCVGRNGNGVAYGLTSVIGRRKEMEDAVKVVPGFISRSCNHVGGCTAPGSRSSNAVSPVHFFGVYDGHGGSQVAKFCEGRMHDVVAEEWDQETVAEYEWHRKWEVALSRGFERADGEIITNAVASEMVGSTAVVVVLSGCQIIASHCGDSRVVLCRGTETIPLTIDQKPDREDELARIEDQGGKVINWNGARVFGVLAMSRAIGDHYLRPWIIPVPEITFTTRGNDDECLILASDGLWDVMSNDEVGEIARRLLRRRRRSMPDDTISPAQTVADSLTEIALSRNSSDNISIVVVDLKPKKNVTPNQ